MEAEREPRDEEREEEDEADRERRRAALQRQIAQDGRDRVRLDLAARHQGVDRRLVDVLERRAPTGPITTILSLNAPFGTCPCSTFEYEYVVNVPAGPA